MQDTLKFEAGKTYATRSICDSECIYEFTIVRRSDKSAWIEVDGEEKRKQISVYRGVEQIKPRGSYSMSIILGADDLIETVEAEPQAAESAPEFTLENGYTQVRTLTVDTEPAEAAKPVERSALKSTEPTFGADSFAVKVRKSAEPMTRAVAKQIAECAIACGYREQAVIVEGSEVQIWIDDQGEQDFDYIWDEVAGAEYDLHEVILDRISIEFEGYAISQWSNGSFIRLQPAENVIDMGDFMDAGSRHHY